MHHYTRSIELAAEQDTVFAFHTDPANLLRISPPSIKTRVLRHDTPGEGAIVELRVHPFPFVTQVWQMRFDTFDPPRRLRDVMLSGPFRVWQQTREFIPLGNGRSLLNDLVEYELPFGLFGRLVNRLFVARQIRKMFAYRQIKTKELLEKSST